MLILTIRTDKPEAEIGLFDDDKKLAYSTWQAHRRLAETIHIKIKELLESQGRSFGDISAVVVFKGPGSFTGLRIGLSAANALAYGLRIPIVAVAGADWLEKGSQAVRQGKDEHIAIPKYGAPPHITLPKH